MTTLSHLNEPGVLWNLKCRYMLDAIYTYTGSILIAVNPFGPLPHMYGPHMMEQYRGADLGELSPHVYAIADSAYRQMRKETRSQSILVSGELRAEGCVAWPGLWECAWHTVIRTIRPPLKGSACDLRLRVCHALRSVRIQDSLVDNEPS